MKTRSLASTSGLVLLAALAAPLLAGCIGSTSDPTDEAQEAFAKATLFASPTTIVLGSAPVGTDLSGTSTISNRGPTDDDIISIDLPPGPCRVDFVGSIPGSSSAPLTLTCTPMVRGGYSGTITIDYSDGTDVHRLAISYRGVAL